MSPAHTRLIRMSLLTGLLLLIVAVSAWMLRAAPIQVELGAVTQAPFQVWIEEEARTRVRDRYGVHAPVSGQLLRMSVAEGDEVAQGRPIARIEPALPNALDRRSWHTQEAAVAAAQAGVAGAQARWAKAQAALAQSQADLARIEALAARGFVASNRLESERLANESARAEQEAQQASLEAARHELARARAGLIDASLDSGPAGRGIDVRAPVRGVVLKRSLPDQTPVQAGALLLEIGDLSMIEVIADLLTTQAVQVRAGQSVALVDWGGDMTLLAKVERIEPAAFTKVSALGVEEQRVRVVMRLLPSSTQSLPALGDGWRLQARILVRSLDSVLQVPSAAVFPWPQGQGQAPPPGHAALGVFIAHKGRARLKTIEGMDRNADQVALREGLSAGEVVVLYPPPRLRDGDRIRAEP
jgi:HlyD family secretion protein